MSNSPTTRNLAERTDASTEVSMLLITARMIADKEVKDWDVETFDFLDRTICHDESGYSLASIDLKDPGLDDICPEAFRHVIILIALLMVEYVKLVPKTGTRTLANVCRHFDLDTNWIAHKVCRLHRGSLFSIRYSTVRNAALKMGCPMSAVLAALDGDWESYGALASARDGSGDHMPERTDIDSYLSAMQAYVRTNDALPPKLEAYRKMVDRRNVLDRDVKVFYLKRLRDIEIGDMNMFTILCAVHEFNESLADFFGKVSTYSTTGKLPDAESEAPESGEES